MSQLTQPVKKKKKRSVKMRRAFRTKRAGRRSVARNTKESVEQIIETRFNRLEDKLDTFKDEINEWKQEFVK